MATAARTATASKPRVADCIAALLFGYNHTALLTTNSLLPIVARWLLYMQLWLYRTPAAAVTRAWRVIDYKS